MEKPNFDKDLIIYTNSMEEAISSLILQKDDQNNEQPTPYMIQSLSNDEIKYTFIEKHTFSLVKDIKKCLHFILGKNKQRKIPFTCCQVFTFTNTSFRKNCTLACKNPRT